MLMSDLFGATGNACLDESALPAGYAARPRALRAVIGALDRRLARFDKEIATRLAGDPGYRAPRRIGVGPVLAALFTAETGDVTRFPSAKHLCSWAGLTPASSQVSPEGDPRACHQTGLHADALAGRRGGPARSRRHLDARPPGPHRGPPRPANCSPWSTAGCATARSSDRPTRTAGEQHPRPRPTRDRVVVRPPPSGETVPLIAPAGRGPNPTMPPRTDTLADAANGRPAAGALPPRHHMGEEHTPQRPASGRPQHITSGTRTTRPPVRVRAPRPERQEEPGQAPRLTGPTPSWMTTTPPGGRTMLALRSNIRRGPCQRLLRRTASPSDTRKTFGYALSPRTLPL